MNVILYTSSGGFPHAGRLQVRQGTQQQQGTQQDIKIPATPRICLEITGKGLSGLTCHQGTRSSKRTSPPRWHTREPTPAHPHQSKKNRPRKPTHTPRQHARTRSLSSQEHAQLTHHKCKRTMNRRKKTDLKIFLTRSNAQEDVGHGKTFPRGVVVAAH